MKDSLRVKLKRLAEAQKNGLPNGSFEAFFLLWTPDLAAEVLAKPQKKARFCPEVAVDRIAADMASGNFAISHQGVAFDKRGTLIDGQRRLRAIVKSGVPALLLTFFDIPDVALTVDATGKLVTTKLPFLTHELLDEAGRRSFADYLGFEQLRAGQSPTVKENHITASVLRKVVFLATGRMGLPVAQLKAIYDIYKDDIAAVLSVRKEFPGLTPLLTNSTVLGCLAFSRKVVPGASDKLMRALFSGKNLKAGMPAQALRMRLSTINKAEPPDDIKIQRITRATLDAVMATFDRRSVVSLDNSRTDTARTRLRAMSKPVIDQILTIIGVAEDED